MAYTAINPGKDLNYPTSGTYAQTSVPALQDIRDPTRLVARERGPIISPANATINITPA